MTGALWNALAVTAIRLSIDFVLVADSIAVGDTTRAIATVRDASGQPLANRSRQVTWSSSNSSVATVALATGTIVGRGAGTAVITGTLRDISARHTITVSGVSAPPPPVPVASVTIAPASASVLPGSTTTLTAVLKDASGATLGGRIVTWATSAGSVATVSNGVVAGVAAGTATITAASEGQSGTANITVTGAPPIIVAASNFNDSTATYPMVNPWGTGLDFPADPTNSGRGRVARLTYAPASGVSMERGVAYEAPSGGVLKLRYAQTMWFKGNVYFPSGTGAWNPAHNRKLIDWQGTGGPRVTLHRVGPDRELKMSIVDCMNGGVAQEVMDPSTGIVMPENAWHTIEVMVRTNSADDVRDGIVEIYMNGAATPTYRRDTGLGWITEKCGGGSFFSSYLVGFQLTIDSGDAAYTEVRYWDDLVFSTARVSP